MLRSYLIAALRNLVRNRLYAAINTTGLAVGFAAAILIALFVREEAGFDRFWPDYQRVYMMSMDLRVRDMSPWIYDAVPGSLPAMLKPRIPAGVLIARVLEETHALRRGNVESNEDILWVDPDLFSILRVRAIAGDLDQAVRRSDGLVLTRSLARKYFGDSPALYQTLEVDREHVMRVAAVVEDIPLNSHFNGAVFASPFQLLAARSGFMRTVAAVGGRDGRVRRFLPCGGAVAIPAGECIQGQPGPEGEWWRLGPAIPGRVPVRSLDNADVCDGRRLQSGPIRTCPRPAVEGGPGAGC
jgi:hypothetical protein